MIKAQDKNKKRQVRHLRVRKRVSGTGVRPRLCVYRSLSHIYAQLIDDVAGHTLVQASTMDPEVKAQLGDANKSDAAKLVGEVLGKRAKGAGIQAAVFDRGGYLYTGRIAALAAGAREAGLDF